jgi:hypothetical protein
MLARRLTYAVAAGRAAIGLALLIDPVRAGRPWTGDMVDSSGGRLLARMVGVRDLTLAVGTMLALREGAPPGRWIGAGVLADTVDAVAAGTGRSLPPAGRAATVAVAAGAAALGAWQLRAVE